MSIFLREFSVEVKEPPRRNNWGHSHFKFRIIGVVVTLNLCTRNISEECYKNTKINVEELI